MHALMFILNAVISFFSILFLLRFLMQVCRVSFSSQPGDFVVRLTSWAVRPLRRVIPGMGGFDWASLLPAFGLQLLLGILMLVFSGIAPEETSSAIPLVLMMAVRGVLRLTVNIFIGALILQAVLSWINPRSPLAAPVWQLTRPILEPIRRVVPSISGIDLSPLVAILLLQVLLMFL